MAELQQEQIDKLKEELIQRLVDEAGIPLEKVLAVTENIEEYTNKLQFPDNYCPICIERMFFKNGGFYCPKCGKQQEVVLTRVAETQLNREDLPPAPASPGEPVFAPRPIKPKRAATILSLRDKMDGGGSAGSTPRDPVDGMPLPGATSKDINWV